MSRIEIFSLDRTQRDNGEDAEKKINSTSKGKDVVHSGARWCPHLFSLYLCGECIETKLTDIFHSINDFTIQLKVQHLFGLVSPLLSAASPVESWVLSAFIVIWFHLGFVCKWEYTAHASNLICSKKIYFEIVSNALLNILCWSLFGIKWREKKTIPK